MKEKPAFDENSLNHEEIIIPQENSTIAKLVTKNGSK